MRRGNERLFTRAAAGALGGGAGAFAMSRVPVLRRVDDRTTALISQAAAERLLHRPLTRRRLDRAIPFIRYGYGTMAGAAYGLFTDNSSAVFTGSVLTGAAWGALLWVVSDWVVLPALASVPPRDEAGRTALSLVAHLIYGVATALVAHSIRTSAT